MVPVVMVATMVKVTAGSARKCLQTCVQDSRVESIRFNPRGGGEGRAGGWGSIKRDSREAGASVDKHKC